MKLSEKNIKRQIKDILWSVGARPEGFIGMAISEVHIYDNKEIQPINHG